MGAKGEVLAKQFEAKAHEAAVVLEKLSDADWKKVTEAEKWTVGVTAHHLAGALEPVAGMVTAIASGRSLGNFTRRMLDEMNAKHAKDHAHCDRLHGGVAGDRRAARHPRPDHPHRRALR